MILFEKFGKNPLVREFWVICSIIYLQMIETAGYEAAAVRNHSPEKETNILVIIIIASSKRYYMSRKKISFVYFFSVSNSKFPKIPKKKENICNSSEFSFHYPSISKLETNSKSSSRLFEQAILTKLSKTSIKVNGSIFLRAIVTVDCEQRGSEQATRNGIINDRSSLSFTARFDSHMAWSIEEKEARVHRRAPSRGYTTLPARDRGTINDGSFYLGGNTSPFPWPSLAST